MIDSGLISEDTKAKFLRFEVSYMDELDLRALIYLTEHGRASWSDLASKLGLSAVSCAERVRKLEERGIIRGWAALVDPSKVGLGLTAFLEVTLEHPQARSKFLDAVEKHPSVLECHHITGDFDYLLKVRMEGTQELETLLSELKGVSGVLKTRTTIALSSPKESTQKINPQATLVRYGNGSLDNWNTRKASNRQ